ncbi:putative two-component response regulator ARR21 isoform X2 [Raphanus sativus]|uniref:Two-component response regulator ARR21 isoform X2 n=1 Tax=Raphanus sativus TaxID=3726 RepID=A0A6J0MTK9_RAPSA|nr:putative two-component response regulator ARR21 isoform X2 [Raphanus sativus]
MAFPKSFDSQNSDLRINVMVVDDDPVFLGVMSRMLENSKYRVIAVKDPIEALSTLKTQRYDIDLIVTDYYMPHMNGLQLKKQITREFGYIPVIVMSSDSNIEHESLACGAKCFLPKPIRPTDIPQIYQVALTHKRNNKSILWTEHNHRDTDVSIPQQIQLLTEQASVLKTNKKRFSPRSDSRPVNSSNGGYVSTDSSGKHQKRKSNDGASDDWRPLKKPKIKWTDCLHDLFLQAIRHIGLDKAVPKKILEFMNLQYLTRENIASHLQKYRIFLRKVAEQSFSCSRMLPTRGIDSIFLQAHLRDQHYNNYTPSSWYETSINNRSFYSKPIQGYGQSRLISNTAEPVRFNQMPYNYMNRSSTYEPRGIGSNLTLPTKSNLSLPIQPSPNDGRRSLFEPTVMANKTGQTSQVMGFGQHGLSAINGNSFHNKMMSSYRSLVPNQPGPSNFSCGMQFFLNNENTTYKPQPHDNATTQPNLEIPQLENLSLCDYLDSTDELPCDINNILIDHNKQQQEEAVYTNKFKLPANFENELDQILSLEENGDGIFVNINQGHSGGETSNIVAAPQTNSPIFNMNPNHEQEQDVPDFVDWSSLDPKDFANEYDFIDSLLSNDMN